jgi:hypothetical protein
LHGPVLLEGEYQRNMKNIDAGLLRSCNAENPLKSLKLKINVRRKEGNQQRLHGKDRVKEIILPES